MSDGQKWSPKRELGHRLSQNRTIQGTRHNLYAERANLLAKRANLLKLR